LRLLQTVSTSCYGLTELLISADFAEVLREIRRMEKAKQRVESELNSADPSDTLIEFLKRANAEISQLNESAQITKVTEKRVCYTLLDFRANFNQHWNSSANHRRPKMKSRCTPSSFSRRLPSSLATSKQLCVASEHTLYANFASLYGLLSKASACKCTINY
jgi:hypothetical protein